jgi:hypothetical protein
VKLRFKHEDEVTRFISSNDALYHFTLKDTAIECILNHKNLRFGSFGFTNDPQEYRPRLTTASGWGWDDNDPQKISKVTRKIDEVIKSSGFLSFCQNRYEGTILVEQGCLKSRMWSQYGGEHTGICLVLSKSRLLKALENKINTDLKIYSDNVEYIDPYERSARSCLLVNGGELSDENIDKIAFNHIDSSIKQVFFQKQPDYKDENEFRVVVVYIMFEQICELYIDISECLEVIILGDSFPKVYMPTIQMLAEKINIPFRKLHWEKNSYILLGKV